MKDVGNWRHICVDAQRMFMEDTPWRVPWLERVVQQRLDTAWHHAQRAVFTRFVPPVRAEDAFGSWKDYYRKWWMTVQLQALLLEKLASARRVDRLMGKPVPALEHKAL